MLKNSKLISALVSILALAVFNPSFVMSVLAEPVFQTTAQATAAAEKLGYIKTNELSSGQAVYKKGKSYITRDIDGHNGGAWKRASSVANLGSKATRDGTYNADLSLRIGD
jgi:Novel toxin 21